MTAVTRELRERHFVGGLLVGAYAIPADFDETPPIADEDLRAILDAATIAANVSGRWPVALDAVADELARLGVLEQVGGSAALLYLVESWSDREERARKLAALMLAYELAQGRLAQQVEAEDAVVRTLRRLEAAREKSDGAIKLMTQAVGA